MLGTINVNRELYIEPNEATWKIVADDATKYLRYSGAALDKYMDDYKKYMDDYKKRHIVLASVQGETKELLRMSIWEFAELFGPHMHIGGGPQFVHNQVYFDIDNISPVGDFLEEREDDV